MTGGPLLSPLAAAYELGVRARLALYRRGILSVRRAGRPVVSIGNIAAGGTGKTPFLRWLAGALIARGQRPSILTRGYGRTSRGTVVVSDGAGRRAGVAESGDEPSLLADALPGVAIVADARRARGAEKAESLVPEGTLHLLDDGFSHVALERDLDVVLLDAVSPDAGGALLPAGRLREPLDSLARADVIVVTKCDEADAAPAVEIARRFAPGVPVYRARTEVLGILGSRGERAQPEDVAARRLVALAGIARPESFLSTLDGLGIHPEAFLPLKDHEPFGDFTLGRIAKAIEETRASAVVATEKDAVKLDGRLPVPLFRVAVEARAVEPSFVSDLLAQLARPPA